MLSRRLTDLARRRGVIAAAAALTTVGSFALGLANDANAAPDTGTRTVTVIVTAAGGYTGTLCVGDRRAARCLDGVRTGQSRTFTVHPGTGEPVTVSVLANGGGSAFVRIVPAGPALRLDVTGSRAEPAIIRR